jgi:hypothetical protein
MNQSITIPPDTLALLRQHANLIENLAEDVPAGQPLVLERDVFPILTDEHWALLSRLVDRIQESDPEERHRIAQELHSIFVVSEYAERHHLTVDAIYNIAVALYTFIGGENGDLDQIEDIFNLGTHINNLGVLSHRLGGVSSDDFKEMGDYLGFHGGRRRKTRKNRQRKY